ncbi:MAG: hypothetical protein KDC44_06675 [Phaeodactylibacter sp.]|nr:hypothetical protein [Phaeodactylibacter sp.]
MDIQYLNSEAIDKVKWNSCIHYANNGNVFGYKWYLDFVAKDWDALVEGDYESVFPLVWRDGRRGSKMLVQPQWMRELGIYSIHVLSPARTRNFIEAIPDSFKQVDIVLNEQNNPPADLDFEVIQELNYQLFLGSDYETLRNAYAPGLVATLEQLPDTGLVPSGSLKPEQLTDLYIQVNGSKTADSTHALLRIMYNALHRGWGFLSGIRNKNGDLTAAAFFINSHGKLLSLVQVETAEGQEKGALAYLMDALLQTNAGRPILLDLNTSDDPLAAALGASSNNYYRIRRDGRRFKWL